MRKDASFLFRKKKPTRDVNITMNIFIVDIQITFHKVTQNENELRYRTITLPTFLPALLSGPLDNRRCLFKSPSTPMAE